MIDDDSEAHTFVEASLPQGCLLEHATSLTDGIAAMEETSYDLILTDLRMPEVPNGDALKACLKASPGCAVMVITALHFPAYAASLIRQGAVWVSFKPDAAIEPEVASRLLGESMLFAVARHEAQQAQLVSLSANTLAIEELKREVRDIRKNSERLTVLEHKHKDDTEELLRLWGKVESQQALVSARLVARETGRWGFWVKVIGLIGTALAAIIAPWAASRWKLP